MSMRQFMPSCCVCPGAVSCIWQDGLHLSIMRSLSLGHFDIELLGCLITPVVITVSKLPGLTKQCQAADARL